MGFVAFITFAVVGLFYNIPFLLIDDEHPNGITRAMLPEGETWAYVQTIALSIAAPALFGGFNSLLVTWYHTLPSVRKYGALLGMNKLFIKVRSSSKCTYTKFNVFLFSILF